MFTRIGGLGIRVSRQRNVPPCWFPSGTCYLFALVGGRELHMMGMALFVIFMLLVAVVYLNLLVAMMTAGYDKVRNLLQL